MTCLRRVNSVGHVEGVVLHADCLYLRIVPKVDNADTPFLLDLQEQSRLFSGIVGLDDRYVGGPSRHGKRDRDIEKAKIAVAIFKAANGVPLFAKMLSRCLCP